MHRTIATGIAVSILFAAAMLALGVTSGSEASTSAAPILQETPTPTLTASPTPTLTSSPTPTPTMAPGTIVTFVNTTGVTASDLHFFVVVNAQLPFGQDLAVDVVANAPGCTAPNASTAKPAEFVFAVSVVWPSACADGGESVTLRLACSTAGFPFDGPCSVDHVLNECEDWTLSGSTIGIPCPTSFPFAPAPTPTPTPPPPLDARLKKISASATVVLSDGQPDLKTLVVQVRNDGDHTENIGVYTDIIPPGGIANPFGCTPFWRVINTIVTLAPGVQTAVQGSPTFNCAKVAGALGQTYTIVAAADAHADDSGACGPFQIQSMTCFNALADDDNDPNDNRATTNGFQVK